MSLFNYQIQLVGGGTLTSRITAKDEKSARERVAKLNKVLEWDWIRELKTAKVSAPAGPKTIAPKPAKPAVKSSLLPSLKPVASVKTLKTKRSKLDNLLYLQSSKCFFCGRVLTKAEASVEHLWPKSKKGTDESGNIVACCVTLNRTFGNMDLKSKVRFVLDQKGDFRCPHD